MAHGDYTGQRKASLAQQYADQQQLAASSMSLVTQVVTEGRNEVIDLFTDEDRWAQQHTSIAQASEDGKSADVVEVDVVDPAMQPVRFRASETIDQITVGKDREFSLQEGRTYQAPRWVVQHLDDKGVVWH